MLKRYNFYVFPRSELPLDLPGATFSCEAAALEFLASHGFDFNLCIQEGKLCLSFEYLISGLRAVQPSTQLMPIV